MRPLAIAALALGIAACAAPSSRGTGDLGLVVERASGSIMRPAARSTTKPRSPVPRRGGAAHAAMPSARTARLRGLIWAVLF